MITQFWQTAVRCASCKKTQSCDQPGQQPPSWVVIAYTENKFDPRQPKNPPQFVQVLYPFCGPVCAAQFALTRAWGSLRTEDEKEKFKESLLSIKWLEEVLDEISH